MPSTSLTWFKFIHDLPCQCVATSGLNILHAIYVKMSINQKKIIWGFSVSLKLKYCKITSLLRTLHLASNFPVFTDLGHLVVNIILNTHNMEHRDHPGGRYIFSDHSFIGQSFYESLLAPPPFSGIIPGYQFRFRQALRSDCRHKFHG